MQNGKVIDYGNPFVKKVSEKDGLSIISYDAAKKTALGHDSLLAKNEDKMMCRFLRYMETLVWQFSYSEPPTTNLNKGINITVLIDAYTGKIIILPKPKKTTRGIEPK